LGGLDYKQKQRQPQVLRLRASRSAQDDTFFEWVGVGEQQQKQNAGVPFDFAQGRLLHSGGKSAASGRDDEELGWVSRFLAVEAEFAGGAVGSEVVGKMEGGSGSGGYSWGADQGVGLETG
jgi:hypothetical protein